MLPTVMYEVIICHCMVILSIYVVMSRLIKDAVLLQSMCCPVQSVALHFMLVITCVISEGYFSFNYSLTVVVFMLSMAVIYVMHWQAKADMIGFVWTGASEIVYITAKGIEQYQVMQTFFFNPKVRKNFPHEYYSILLDAFLSLHFLFQIMVPHIIAG